MVFKKKEKTETLGVPSFQKPKGKGRIIVGIVFLLIGAALFVLLIPQLTVTPEVYNDEFKNAKVGSTWTIHGHVVPEESIDVGGKTWYFYTFEEDEEANISSSIDLGGKGTEVIVEVEKTSAEVEFAETSSSTNLWVYNGTGIFFMLIGIILLATGARKLSKTKISSDEGKGGENTDISHLMGGASPGMQTQGPAGGGGGSQQPGMPFGNPPGPHVPPGATGMQPPMMPPPPNRQPGPGNPQNAPSMGGGLQELPGMESHPLPAPGSQLPQTPPPGTPPGMGMQPMQSSATHPPLPGGPQSNPPESLPPGALSPIGQQQFPVKTMTGTGQSMVPHQPPAPRTPPTYQAQSWTCPNCQTTVEPKFAFCTSCGYKRHG